MPEEYSRYAATTLDEEFYKWAHPAAEGGETTVRPGVTDSHCDEVFEVEELRRHRTMIWELMSNYCRGDKYTPWHNAHYRGTVDPPLLPLQTPYFESGGYGPPRGDAYGRTVPPAAGTFSKLRSMEAPTKAPGLNFAPGNSGAIDAAQLDEVWDGVDDVLTDFGGARGAYELFTDFFVDVCDGFRGAYINGDLREICKSPVKEDYAWVGDLYEELYGLKNGWGWTAVQGTKEHQCDTLGGYEFGRLSETISFLDYKGSWSDKHPSDPDGSGGRIGDGPGPFETRENGVDHRFGNYADFGIYDHVYTGPLKKLNGGEGTLDNEKPLDSSDAEFGLDAADANGNQKYKLTDHHGSVDLVKIGYGLPGDDNVVSTQEHKTNRRIWEETRVGASVYMTDTASHTGIYSEQLVGDSKITSDFVAGELTENTGEAGKLVNITSTHWGNETTTHHGDETTTHNGMATSTHLGDVSDTYMGWKNENSLTGSNLFELSIKNEMVAGAANALFIGILIDTFIGGKVETVIGPKKEINITNKDELALAKKTLVAKKTEIVATAKKVGLTFKKIAAKIDLGL